jgi:tetratricopeptide (TPR) repeat protein
MTTEHVVTAIAARPLRTALAVLGVAICLQLPGVGGGFFSDDYVYVVGNPHLKTPIGESWKFFTTQTNHYEYLPIRDLSYRLDAALFGEHPLGYKLHNLLLYGFACFASWLAARVVFRFFARLRGEDEASPFIELYSLAALALFAFHPAHVESVAWISGRKDLLSGGLALASLWLFTRALMDEERKRGLLIWASALYALALLSKMTVVPMGAVMVVLAFVRHGIRDGRWRKAVAVSAPFIAITLLALLLGVLIAVQSVVIPKNTFSDVASLSSRIWLRALVILGSLWRIAALPLFPRVIYSVGEPGLPFVSAIIFGVLAVLAAVWGVLRTARYRSIVGFGAFAFLLFCLPFLQLLPFITWSYASDRFLFLGVWAGALAVVPMLLRHRTAFGIGVLGLVLAVYAVVTLTQSAVWCNTDDVYRQSAETSPTMMQTAMMHIDVILLPAKRYDEARACASKVKSVFGRELLKRYVDGMEAEQRGDTARAFGEAAWIETAIGIDAPSMMLLFVAQQYAHKGATFEACRYFSTARPWLSNNDDQAWADRELARIRAPYLRRMDALQREAEAHPGDLRIWGALANQQLELSMYADAERNLRKLIEWQPQNGIAHFNLALALEGQQSQKAAVTEYETALACGMGEAFVHNNLGLACKRLGRFEDAARAFAAALRADPGYWFAPYNLGLMRSEEGNKVEATAALAEAKRILAASGGDTSIIDMYVRVISASAE